MSEVLLQIEQRDDGRYYVQYHGRDFGLLTEPVFNYQWERYGVYGCSRDERVSVSFDMVPLAPPPKTKPTVSDHIILGEN